MIAFRTWKEYWVSRWIITSFMNYPKAFLSAVLLQLSNSKETTSVSSLKILGNLPSLKLSISLLMVLHRSPQSSDNWLTLNKFIYPKITVSLFFQIRSPTFPKLLCLILHTRKFPISLCQHKDGPISGWSISNRPKFLPSQLSYFLEKSLKS